MLEWFLSKSSFSLHFAPVCCFVLLCVSVRRLAARSSACSITCVCGALCVYEYIRARQMASMIGRTQAEHTQLTWTWRTRMNAHTQTHIHSLPHILNAFLVQQTCAGKRAALASLISSFLFVFCLHHVKAVWEFRAHKFRREAILQRTKRTFKKCRLTEMEKETRLGVRVQKR